jgi:hypothetical protein
MVVVSTVLAVARMAKRSWALSARRSSAARSATAWLISVTSTAVSPAPTTSPVSPWIGKARTVQCDETPVSSAISSTERPATARPVVTTRRRSAPTWGGNGKRSPTR